MTDAEALALSRWHALLDQAELPLPTRRQLVEKGAYGGRAFLLMPAAKGQARTAAPRVVGRYRTGDRVITKPFDPGRHYHRRGDGVAWNLELFAIADRWRPRPAAIELVFAADTDRPRPQQLVWKVARRYAAAIALGDLRWLVADAVDRQVLIPYDATAGLVIGPPLRVIDQPAPPSSPADTLFAR